MAIESKKLTLNAASAIVQVVFTAILYFFLYKYLLNSIGVEKLGVWSLILSFSSIANLANFGLTSGLVKFVAEYTIESDHSKIGKLILTSVISMSALFTILSLIVYLGAHYFLHYVVEPKFLNLAIEILPFSLISLSINAVAGVFTSVLEGYQKNYLRNSIYIFSGIFMIGLVLWLTPMLNLRGVAIAQTLQALFILILSIVYCHIVSKYNRLKFWKWSNQSFKELFNYGYKFQAVSIAQLLYEPTTKMLLSKFGGLALLGHYEMASRLVTQFRALLVNANQVVVPVIAQSNRISTKEETQLFFRKMNQVVSLFAFPLATILMLSSPFISYLWLGNVNIDFIFAVLVLSVSASFNIVCGPSYFSCLAEGKLNLLIKVHVFMALSNLILSYLLVHLLSGYGVIIGWGITLTLGSLLLIRAYLKNTERLLLDVFSPNETIFSISVIGFAVLIYAIELLSKTNTQLYILLGVLVTTFLFLMYLLLARSEVYRELRMKLSKGL